MSRRHESLLDHAQKTHHDTLRWTNTPVPGHLIAREAAAGMISRYLIFGSPLWIIASEMYHKSRATPLRAMRVHCEHTGRQLCKHVTPHWNCKDSFAPPETLTELDAVNKKTTSSRYRAARPEPTSETKNAPLRQHFRRERVFSTHPPPKNELIWPYHLCAKRSRSDQTLESFQEKY